MKSQLSQLQKRQTLLKIFIFTLVTVIIWVGLTLFRTQQETGIRPELITKSEALNPNINIEVVDQLEQKRQYTDQELSDFPIYTIFTTKSGEEQLVVFSASDRTKQTVVSDTPEASTTPQQQTSPGVTNGETAPNPEGGVVTTTNDPQLNPVLPVNPVTDPQSSP